MASVPEKPIAEWLRASRLSQAMPNGDPWTYDYLFAQMRGAIGWAPPHPNYSRYENGKSTPNRDTLAKFIRFWATRGVDGPDLTPHVAEEEATPSSAIQPVLERIDALVETVRVQNALIIRLLGGPGPDQVADLKQWAAEQLATTQLPLPNEALRAER